jgi:hypothetical protein
VAGGDAGGKAAARLAEVKAARAAAAKLWPDTAARLGRLEAALEAQQDAGGGEDG